MKILITGDKGFIGSHLKKRLIDLNHEVQGYDLKRGEDICDFPRLFTEMYEFRPDLIFHLAAYHPISWGERSPMEDARVNILGTLNVVAIAAPSGTKMVYSSTGSVYGNLKVQPVEEEDVGITAPESFYGTSKLCAEQYLRHFAQKRGHDNIIVRFSSVYGPGRIEGPINQMLENVLSYSPVTVYGDGSITRDYTYIDDIIDGLVLIANDRFPWRDTYNLGSGVETSVNQVVQTIREMTGVDFQVNYEPERVGDITKNYFDISRARKYGFDPKISLREGLEKLWEIVD